MKSKPLLHTLAGITLAAITAHTSRAEVLAVDDFSYDDGSLTGKGAAGDGWSGGWTNQFGAAASIRVNSGVVSGKATSGASQRNFRQLAASVAALTNGSAANDNTTIYVGIDWEFGAAYGGLELVNSAFAGNATFRLQLGSQGTGRDLRTGSTIHVPSANFNPLSEVNRYIMAITYNNTTGDMVELFKNGVSIGASVQNAANDFSFNRVGFGVFVEPNGSILHSDNLIIATTFDEASLTAGEPLRITAFSYDPTDGSAEASVEGAPNTRYKLVKAADLDFSAPDQDPVPLLGATVGTLVGGVNVITDENGKAAVQFNLGTGPATFIRAEETGAIVLASFDFETNGQGFTPNGDWAWGKPASNNGVVGGQVTAGNVGSTGAWGTVLGDGGPAVNGGVTPGTTSVLRSANINLAGISGASLAFAAAVDAVPGDTLEVIVRNAADNLPIGDPITPFPTNFPANAAWRNLGPFALPQDAGNKTIYLEFRFAGTSADYLGFYLDDVIISY